MALDYGMILNQPSIYDSFSRGQQQAMQAKAAQMQMDQAQKAQESAELQAARTAAFNGAFSEAYQSGNKEQLTSLIGQFPEQFEQIKQAAGFQDETRNKALGSLGIQIKTQIESGNPQAAAALIANNADVLRSSGPGYEPESLIQRLQDDPAGLAQQADTFSLLTLGPDKYYEVMGGREKLDTQRRGQDITARGQDVQMAEGAANRANAMSIKQLGLQDKQLDREVQRLGQMAAAETNELKRQELNLKVQEKQQKLDTVRQAATAQKESAIANMTEAAQIATELADSPQLGNIVGTVTTMIPTTIGESQDLINKASRLQSLLTVDNLKLMSGVLTDRDIAFLTNVASGLNVQEGGIKGSVPGVQKRLGEISTKISQKLAAQQPAAASGGWEIVD